MNVGLIARADARGLGHITREFFRHMRPARTLVVIPDVTAGHEQHREWYRDRDRGQSVSHVRWTNYIPDENARPWLDGLDVLWTAETFYDWRLVDWAADAGVSTVVHANPEFYRPAVIAKHPPSAVWNQSPWRHDTLRGDAVVVPVPVATDRFTAARTRSQGPLRVLHVAGANAGHDRNGTPAFMAALALTTQPVDVTVVTQGQCKTPKNLPPGVCARVERVDGDYWEMYADQDVLVLPRRWAGQSLPTQEAMAAGLAVVMTDFAPNQWWDPVMLVPAAAGTPIQTPGGVVDTCDVDVGELAATIDRLASDRGLLADRQAAGLDWAADHSWARMTARYHDLLADVHTRAATGYHTGRRS